MRIPHRDPPDPTLSKSSPPPQNSTTSWKARASSKASTKLITFGWLTNLTWCGTGVDHRVISGPIHDLSGSSIPGTCIWWMVIRWWSSIWKKTMNKWIDYPPNIGQSNPTSLHGTYMESYWYTWVKHGQTEKSSKKSDGPWPTIYISIHIHTIHTIQRTHASAPGGCSIRFSLWKATSGPSWSGPSPRSKIFTLGTTGTHRDLLQPGRAAGDDEFFSTRNAWNWEIRIGIKHSMDFDHENLGIFNRWTMDMIWGWYNLDIVEIYWGILRIWREIVG